jgi:general secretion pathway protein C
MKQYIIPLNLLLIAVAIYFSVSAFYKVGISQMDNTRIPGYVKKQSHDQTDAPLRPLSYYKPIIKRNLFKTKEKEKAVQKPKEEPVQEMKLTELRLKLWGTVTGGGSKSYAVIQDAKKRKQELYEVGDTVQNATVKDIFRDKIILSLNGKDEILKIEDRRSSRRSYRRAVSSGSKQRPLRTQKVRIKRSQIEKAVSNVNNLMRQARIRPHFRNGQPDGITLTRIRPNSIFRRLGLRNGDIITGVDGQAIQTADDALGFYNSLKSSSNVTIQIRRRGRTKNIEYDIM